MEKMEGLVKSIDLGTKTNKEKLNEYFQNSGRMILTGGGKHNTVGALLQILLEIVPLA